MNFSYQMVSLMVGHNEFVHEIFGLLVQIQGSRVFVFIFLLVLIFLFAVHACWLFFTQPKISSRCYALVENIAYRFV